MKKDMNAIDKVRQMVANGQVSQEVAEKYFPELQESDGGKIRERLIAFLSQCKSVYGDSFQQFGLNIDEALAWVEKQGEHNTANNVEPKFKVGDIITNGELIGKVDEIVNNKYHGWFGYNKDLSTHYADIPDIEDWHLWTIQDAKAGDVLYMDNGLSTCTFIYKSINNVIIQKYASYNKFRFEGTTYLVLNDGYVCPATKEQRDLLFQKMKIVYGGGCCEQR